MTPPVRSAPVAADVRVGTEAAAAVPAVITLSLVSHTNVGKTTLARTLLRRDIGEVADRAHLTEIAQMHTLASTPEGSRLDLADTPGFGDSVRLARRLATSDTPLVWLLTRIWDRITDRAFWSSQQAVANVRDVADVVLYLVNAAEDPRATGYIAPEMRILGWIGKPVIVVLNQLGPARGREAEARDEAVWREALKEVDCVRAVLPLDAFTRFWVHEDALLGAVAPLLPEAKWAAFAALRAQWRAGHRACFAAALDAIAAEIAATLADQEKLAERGWTDRTRRTLRGVLGAGDAVAGDEAAALGRLAERLDHRVRATTDRLIALHQLAGSAAGEIDAQLARFATVQRPADPATAGVLGGLVSGALGGLAADLAAGGLTFGAGAVIGGVLGALGSSGAARAWNSARGIEEGSVRWSAEFLAGRFGAGLLRYLAVAHFGRGRGEFVAGEAPEHWRAAVDAEVQARQAELLSGLARLRDAAETAPGLADDVRRLLEPIGTAAILRLYPEARGFFDAPATDDPNRSGSTVV